MYATTFGAVQAVEYLKKEYIMKQTKEGLTALMLAAATGNVEIVNMLLGEAGKLMKDGSCAIMRAAEKDQLEIVKILEEKELPIRQ